VVVKIIAESLSQHDEKHVVLTPLSGIKVGKRKNVMQLSAKNLLSCTEHRGGQKVNKKVIY
jgi:hypothetical protein